MCPNVLHVGQSCPVHMTAEGNQLSNTGWSSAHRFKSQQWLTEVIKMHEKSMQNTETATTDQVKVLAYRTQLAFLSITGLESEVLITPKKMLLCNSGALFMARSVVSSPLCPFSLMIYSMDYTTVASNILCYRLTGKHTARGEKNLSAFQ